MHTFFHHTFYQAIALMCYTRSPRSHPTRTPPELQHASARGPGPTRSVSVHDRPDIKHAKNKEYVLLILPAKGRLSSSNEKAKPYS